MKAKQTEELIKQIDSAKISKEERFKEMVNGLVFKINNDGSWKYETKGGQWMLYKSKNGCFYVYYYKFWRIFEREFKANHSEISTFIQEQMLEVMNRKVNTPIQRAFLAGC